eukprot:2211005-Alexandrium_andersonii.AAC.1
MVKLIKASCKTYILRRCVETGKWPHLVSVYDKCAGEPVDHLAVGSKLFKEISSKNLDASEAVELRAKLLRT